MAKKTEPTAPAEILRLPAEIIYAEQLQALSQNEADTPPSSWKLSPRSVLTYIIGGKNMQWKIASNAFAKALHSIGVIDSPVAKSVPREGAGAGEIPMLMSSDMQFVGPRAMSVGFQNEEISLLEFLEGKDIFRKLFKSDWNRIPLLCASLVLVFKRSAAQI